MIRLLSTATGTNTTSSTTTDTANMEGGNKSRLRMGLDWFQSQLLSADGMALPNFERRKQRRVSQWNGNDTAIHRIQINLDKNTTQYIIGLGDYSDKEYHDTFFDSQDLKLIFEQAYQVVEKLQAGEIDPKICTRGLDKLYGERQEACRTIRSKSINAVMDLQEEQWNNEADDFEELAKACREITKEAKRRAVSEARQDTRAAQSYLRDVDTSKWDDITITSDSKTKSILKVRTCDVGLPTGQPLFPDVRNHNGSFHDLRRSPFANSTTPLGRESRETRRVFPSSPNTPMQRSKERLVKQPTPNTSQSRRQAIAESMDHAGVGKDVNASLADSNHSQASFAMDDDRPPPRSRVIRRSSSAGALAMKANGLPQNRNPRSINNEDEGKGKVTTKDLERKRVAPNRTMSSGESNLHAMTPSSHRRRLAAQSPTTKGDPPAPPERPATKKRAPPSRSKSDVTGGLGPLSSPLLQQRRTNPSSSNDDGNLGKSAESKGEKKTQPQRSKSGLVAGAKISRFARPSPLDGNDTGSVTEISSKGNLKKPSPRSPSEHSQKADSSEEILCLDEKSTDTKNTKKKHLPRRNNSDLHRRGVGGAAADDDSSMAKIKIKLNKEITQNPLPSRRLSNGTKNTPSGGSDVAPGSTRGTNGKKKVPVAKSTSDHGPRKQPSDHDRSPSETERTSKGKSAPKKTSSGRSVSEHHRKEVSSADDDEIFSLDGSSQDEKVVKKKALPRRSLSDQDGSKHLSFDDDDLSENPKSSRGNEVKKRAPPQRSASGMQAPGGKSSNARAPPRERPE